MRHHLSYVLCICVACLSASFAWAEIDQSASIQQLEALKQNIRSIDQWLDKANSEKSGLAKQLRKYEKEIASISTQIRGLTAKNRQLLNELKTLKTQEKKQLTELGGQKEALIKQLKAIYLQGRQPAIKLLLDSDDPQDLSRYITYFSYINEARSEKIEEYKSALDALAATERSILKQQTLLAQNRQALQESKTSLTRESQQRKRVLVKLEGSIKSKSQELEKLKADQGRLESLLREVEQAIANISLPDDAAPFATQKSKLPWPARGKLRERFGSRIAQGKLKSRGIRIVTGNSESVQAVHYGRVVFSDWLRGFGLLLIIDHGDGYMTLYGNNQSLVKETGDWVSGGDIISYSGNSGGAGESGLYFEIRRHGKPLNPTKWLRKI